MRNGALRDNKTTVPAADRPTDPDAAQNCPVAPAAESRCLFHGGGGDDNPLFDDEEMEV